MEEEWEWERGTHSAASKTEMPTSPMSSMQHQIDEGNIDDYCYQPSLIHAVQ